MDGIQEHSEFSGFRPGLVVIKIMLNSTENLIPNAHKTKYIENINIFSYFKHSYVLFILLIYGILTFMSMKYIMRDKKLSMIKSFIIFCIIFIIFSLKRYAMDTLNDCHTLPDSANGRVTDSKILCPFVSVRMRFLSVRHAVNAFCVR